ncbi:hypothetical protein LTR32_001260 [Rachicladosporium monterosium]|uniref:FAD-binding PCMH-type domain-containing protein n=1 Tax=Rachicladosporium monterosium TaxID=1507873 RepID=A0ABR0LDP2_9PEZI|nr:hypothetical protein LTR32_001260 [Rachicladosporium monterosium]
MATLTSLKHALRQEATGMTPSARQALSDSKYRAGFEILLQGSWQTIYQNFILPELISILTPLIDAHSRISALEVGPGPRSVLGYLPHCLTRQIKRYAAFEPNGLFATALEQWLCSDSGVGPPLPGLDSPPEVYRAAFTPDADISITDRTNGSAANFNLILLCHSMYGMKPKRRYIERALTLLSLGPGSGVVVIFHRGETLHLDGLGSNRTATFPTGVVRVADEDDVLDCFSSFIAGFVLQDMDAHSAFRAKSRKVCRTLGRREQSHPGRLCFSSPDVMVALTQHAASLPKLMAQVPVVSGDIRVKNRMACLNHPAFIARPTQVQHVQKCVRWALDHGIGLTVIGGGHSSHCRWPNVVSVDMSAFDQVHFRTGTGEGASSGSASQPFAVVEAGCRSGDITRKTMAAGLTIPLGGRPSVGAGLWLQGGIGHLMRLYGLACDAIVGAVVVSVASAQTLCVGHVSEEDQPMGAIRPEDEDDHVTFKADRAPTYRVRNWLVSLSGDVDARLSLKNLDQKVASRLPRTSSVDAYLYFDTDKMRLGVTMFECATVDCLSEASAALPTLASTIFGQEDSVTMVDGLGMFETEMYMSKMHGGHGGGKTSAFKRCLFLQDIEVVDVADLLVSALGKRPSHLCYLHLLHGGGAVGDVAADGTAFGCRNWNFACVVTGVWPRQQDDTAAARAAIHWVYSIAHELLPLSSGAYAADLGPDPRDAVLATKAFGPNLPRLSRLKRSLDPANVLAYACPLPKVPAKPSLIILVTGEHGAGKDYCARVWVTEVIAGLHKGFTARAVSISEAIKRDYAAASGADLNSLLQNRAYKERHRETLTNFYYDQVQRQPRLPQQHFLRVVHSAANVDVLFITGMTDEAPVARLSHLVPDSKLLEVSIRASLRMRQTRRGCESDDGDHNDKGEGIDSTPTNSRPSLIFDNDTTGIQDAQRFFEQHLLPLFHDDLRRLSSMVRTIHHFPRQNIEFRDILGICQQPGGLGLCTSLLKARAMCDWTRVDVVASCETGGLVFASALAMRVDLPLALIREAGKLPPPTASVISPLSHISSLKSSASKEKEYEIGQSVICSGARVAVVDDVLATGKTLCVILKLLGAVGVGVESIEVLVVAEFPIHRGRELLRQSGFGRVSVQSLLVFGNA